MDLEDGLAAFADRSFDYVILSETLQAIHRQEPLLQDMLRVGREAIVSFPNFGYWRARIQIALAGHMPVSKELPYQWYDTPNVHHCTLVDFEALCAKLGFQSSSASSSRRRSPSRVLPNLLGSPRRLPRQRLALSGGLACSISLSSIGYAHLDICRQMLAIQHWMFVSRGICFSRWRRAT